MDPTAPNKPSDPASKQASPNSIQPGQFVVAGDSSAQAAPAAPTQTGPIAGMTLAQDNTSLGEVPQSPPPSPASVPGAQPDPTPFAPPIQPFANQQTVPDAAGGGGSKTKLILIVLAVLVLISIIAAVIFFFILPKTSIVQTTTTQEIIEETSPPPQRIDGGFGTIPQSTESGTPAEDTPPATGNELPAPGNNPTTGF